ncbi:MAG: D-2-hydroxyacid dehydrogenase [Pseudomonadota bacterium]
MHGVFLDTATMKPDELDFSALRATLDSWDFHERTAPAEVADRIAGADVIVTNKVVITGDHLRTTPRLKLVCVCATGTNNVDLDAARAAGIPVRNVTGYAAASVAQHTLALMLGLATCWHRYHEAVLAGDWARSPMFCLMDYPVSELAGKTLGIVGSGHLGSRVAQLGEAFGMSVIVAQLPGRPAGAAGGGWPRLPWHEFLARADYVSLHCPLTPETRHLLGERELRMMKPGAFLINTARGGIVDEAALLQALRENRIAGAALDVLEQEPPAADHPLIAARLPNLLLTPHNAWVSRECRQRLLDGVTGNIVTWRGAQHP